MLNSNTVLNLENTINSNVSENASNNSQQETYNTIISPLKGPVISLSQVEDESLVDH